MSGSISDDGRTIVACEDGNLIALANWKLGPESVACWELNLSWTDPDWDRYGMHDLFENYCLALST